MPNEELSTLQKVRIVQWICGVLTVFWFIGRHVAGNSTINAALTELVLFPPAWVFFACTIWADVITDKDKKE